MTRPVFYAALLLAAGCATHRARNACLPETGSLGGVYAYRACAVDRAARELGSGVMPDFTPTAGNCFKATIDMVVDSMGIPQVKTAKVVTATDASFAAAIVSALPTRRFQPALKDGHPVAQIVRVDRKLVRITSTGPVRPTESDARRAAARC